MHQQPHKSDGKNELYITNLEEEINEQILYNIFCSYGHILSVKIMRHILDRRPRGFAFITYKFP